MAVSGDGMVPLMLQESNI